MTNLELLMEYMEQNQYFIGNDLLAKYNELLQKEKKEQLTLTDVGSSLPDLAECNQASLDYATKKDNPDFFLIKQTFKEGINWALNYITKQK